MQVINFRNITIGTNTNDYILTSFSANDIELERQENKFYGVDGSEFTNALYNPRICRLQGVIAANDNNSLNTLRKALVNACDGKTSATLYYTVDNNYYKATAFAEVVLSEKEGTTTDFSIKFTLPKFYWQDTTEVIHSNVPIYANGIPTFTSTNTLTNLYTDTFCKIIITYTVSGTITDSQKSANANKGIEIENYAKGVMKFNYIPVNGEIVTINTETMKITSNKTSGNLIQYLSLDSDNLKVFNGENKFFYYNKLSDLPITATVQIHYTPQYIGV